MDFKALYEEVNRRLHGSTSNAVFLTELKTAVNLSRKQIVAMMPNVDFLQIEATIALIADQIEYSMANDVVKVNPEEIRLATTRTRLSHLDKSSEGFISPLNAGGTTSHYRLSGFQKIQLYVPPDAALVTAETNVAYEYTKTFPTDMVSDTDPHGLPPHMEPVIIDLELISGLHYA